MRRACGCLGLGWRSRRWLWFRRTRRRACQSRSRRWTLCRRRACRGACERRCRPASARRPLASMIWPAALAGMPWRTSLIFSLSTRMSACVGRVRIHHRPVTDQRAHSHLPPMRCSHDWGARPVSTCSIVMQPSTGQTSAQRLQPTHSSSSTRGMRASGVAQGPDPRRSLRPASRSASSRSSRGSRIRLARACGGRSPVRRGRDGCIGARRPSRRCSRDRSRCIFPDECAR